MSNITNSVQLPYKSIPREDLRADYPYMLISDYKELDGLIVSIPGRVTTIYDFHRVDFITLEFVDNNHRSSLRQRHDFGFRHYSYSWGLRYIV